MTYTYDIWGGKEIKVPNHYRNNKKYLLKAVSIYDSDYIMTILCQIVMFPKGEMSQTHGKAIEFLNCGQDCTC